MHVAWNNSARETVNLYNCADDATPGSRKVGGMDIWDVHALPERKVCAATPGDAVLMAAADFLERVLAGRRN